MCQTHLFEFLRCTRMDTLSVNIGKQNHLLSAQCEQFTFCHSTRLLRSTQKSSTPYISTIANSHYLFSTGFVAHCDFSPWSNLWYLLHLSHFPFLVGFFFLLIVILHTHKHQQRQTLNTVYSFSSTPLNPAFCLVSSCY